MHHSERKLIVQFHNKTCMKYRLDFITSLINNRKHLKTCNYYVTWKLKVSKEAQPGMVDKDAFKCPGNVL